MSQTLKSVLGFIENSSPIILLLIFYIVLVVRRERILQRSQAVQISTRTSLKWRIIGGTNKLRQSLPLYLGGIKEKKLMRKRAIDLTLKKEGMDTVVHIKVAKEIEDFFKRAATTNKTVKTETSAKWLDAEGEGLDFYVKSEKLSDKVNAYGPIMDNFGNGLMEGSKINLAPLRIVGAGSEDGVTFKTDDLLSFQETKQYIESLANWTKAFYEENLRDQELTASVTFEIE